MKEIQEGGKFVPTSGFYFLFYSQDQIPKLNEKNIKINNFIQNLRIDEEIKENIKEYKNNIIIENIKKFNNIFKKDINSTEQKNILDYKYYIFYLINIYNYKEDKKNLINRLIYNELLDKFNIILDIQSKTNKNNSLEIIKDNFINTIKIIDNNDFIDVTTKENINSKYQKNLKFFESYLKTNINIKNLYSDTNMTIINLIDNNNNEIYQFNKTIIPTYNSIVQELMLSFIVANNSDLMKMCIVETHKFNLAISKVMGSQKLKDKIYKIMEEKGFDRKMVETELNKIAKGDIKEFKYKMIINENKSNKSNKFFTLKYSSLWGTKHYKTNNDFKDALIGTKINALKIINYLRKTSYQKYDSYIVFEVLTTGNKYLYSHIFKDENFELKNRDIQSGGELPIISIGYMIFIAIVGLILCIVIKVFTLGFGDCSTTIMKYLKHG